jgi:hypothetical protein
MSKENFRFYNPLTMGATPTNSNPNAQFERDFRLFLRDALKENQPSENPELLAQMHAQKQEEIRQAKEMGLLGGRGESSRNPGGADNTGLDWLRGNYNPGNNPAEGRDVQGMARQAVEEQKRQQVIRQRQEGKQIHDQGFVNQDIGGATQTNFYNDREAAGLGYAQGQPTAPAFSTLNVPQQYGGGQGSGLPAGRRSPSIQGNEQLPTGGYNADAGVGGSGVPMSASEAYGTDNLGNGIYGERDRSNPASQDAIMARDFARNRGIDQMTKAFFAQQIAQGIPASVAASNAVAQGMITPEEAKSLEIGAATEMSAPRPASDAGLAGQGLELYGKGLELAGRGTAQTAGFVLGPDAMNVTNRYVDQMRDGASEALQRLIEFFKPAKPDPSMPQNFYDDTRIIP